MKREKKKKGMNGRENEWGREGKRREKKKGQLRRVVQQQQQLSTLPREPRISGKMNGRGIPREEKKGKGK